LHGSVLTAGELSRDRETFFAQRILSFVPDLQQRRLRAPLRRIEFLRDHAFYSDSRRKVEIMLPGKLSWRWQQVTPRWPRRLRRSPKSRWASY
jgi:hypothetical protein